VTDGDELKNKPGSAGLWSLSDASASIEPA
jgi:hypothetical protein